MNVKCVEYIKIVLLCKYKGASQEIFHAHGVSHVVVAVCNFKNLVCFVLEDRRR
jgi:Na+-translocating ferredoxin:NAD+ oxidoreductase RnfA subunit